MTPSHVVCKVGHLRYSGKRRLYLRLVCNGRSGCVMNKPLRGNDTVCDKRLETSLEIGLDQAMESLAGVLAAGLVFPFSQCPVRYPTDLRRRPAAERLVGGRQRPGSYSCGIQSTRIRVRAKSIARTQLSSNHTAQSSPGESGVRRGFRHQYWLCPQKYTRLERIRAAAIAASLTRPTQVPGG